MENELFYENPYLTTLKTKIIRIDENNIILDNTIFYPGGGGQEHDLGYINELIIKRVFIENGNILHEIEDHDLNVGDAVNCELNWKRRYELMKSHTAEHLLMGTLKQFDQNLEVSKIYIGENKKNCFVNGNLNWKIIRDAQNKVNKRIIEGAKVQVQNINSEDAKNISKLRIKWDKIKAKTIRIVKIEDIDISACSGLHVNNINEIGMLLINRFIKGKKASDFEIEFLINSEAKIKSLELASYITEISNSYNTIPVNLLSLLNNLKNELNVYKERHRLESKNHIKNLEPNISKKYKIYSKIFHGLNKKELINGATNLTENEKNIVIFINITDKLFIIIACHDSIDINCVKLMNNTIKPIGGQGGGKKNFAMGGGKIISEVEILMRKLINELVTELRI